MRRRNQTVTSARRSHATAAAAVRKIGWVLVATAVRRIQAVEATERRRSWATLLAAAERMIGLEAVGKEEDPVAAEAAKRIWAVVAVISIRRSKAAACEEKNPCNGGSGGEEDKLGSGSVSGKEELGSGGNGNREDLGNGGVGKEAPCSGGNGKEKKVGVGKKEASEKRHRWQGGIIK